MNEYTFSVFEELWNTSKALVKSAHFLHNMMDEVNGDRELYAQAVMLHNAAVDFIKLYDQKGDQKHV